MAVRYGQLMRRLAAVARRIESGQADLATIDLLVTALGEATGAVGATFTEYTNDGGRADGGRVDDGRVDGGRVDGGRVVAAAGTLRWALGQPISGQLVSGTQPDEPWSSRVEELPDRVAQPLLSRGVHVIAGHPVRVSGRLVGAVHIYYGESDPEGLHQVREALRLAAALACGCYRDRAPSTVTAPEDDDRSLFLAVAGHELRTPVTVVKGYAGVLADRWDDLDESSRREAAAVLSQRADELARLVDRLLGATVGDAATGWLVRTVPFDSLGELSRAAQGLPAELRRLVRLDLPSRLPPAYGDPATLAPIVAELVTNAARATAGPDATSIEVRAGADADTVYFRVLDRGLGLDPGDVERAFERFWRDGRDDGRAGVGLGLYLVRRLVERQGGWVSLRARDGGGTIAEVRLLRADRPPRRSGEA